jgi:signal transduction histidine kinase
MPAILAWISERHIWMREHPTYFIEQAALLVALIFLAHLAFATPTTTSHPALLYSLVPLLLWSTLRFGTMGVSTSITAITFLSIWEAVHGRGPFTEPGPIVNVASLQLFLFFTAAPFMTLSVLVEERKRSEDERVNERTRIARELHDTLLQSVQALLLRLLSVSNALPELPATAEAKKRLNSAIDQTEQAITESRDAVQGLRSSTMPNDFAAALNTLASDLATMDGNQSPPAFHVEVEGTPRELKPVLRDEIYRIAGEAVRNAFRHANAHSAEVAIRYDEKQLTVRVRDDGKGISPEIVEAKGRAGHYGLQGMRERASKIGAQLELWSRPEAGTEMELKIPAATAYQSRGAWGNWFWSGRSDINTQA